MRTLPPAAEQYLRAALEPRSILRWVYIARVSVATAILGATLMVWQHMEKQDILIATLAFALSVAFTAASATYSEAYRRPIGQTFCYLQIVFDLLLVTAIVHVTGGSASQFAALYILVIASASLLLPIGGGLLIAALGNVLYFADAIWGSDAAVSPIVWLQLSVFACVALSAGFLGSRVQEAGAGKQVLADELVKVRLQAADILRNIRSGIVTIDTGGRLVYANPAAGALLGLDIDSIVGQPVLARISIVAPELGAALQRCVHDRVRTTRAEGIIKLAERELTIGVTTTCDEGETDPARTTATAIFQDISDQKRLDALHLRAERLEAVAELSASLAHEIKNPLASIRSAVEQLSRIPSAGDDERTLSELIVRESDRLSRLLSEFLDFARVRVSRVSRVDLAAIVEGAATLAAAHPDRTEGVTLTCSVPEQPLLIDGDEDLLHRAVFNLALNAVQATTPRGQVSIELGPLSYEQTPAGVWFEHGAVRLRVSDDGPGIPPEIRDRLFDPFFTTKPGGTGLGLPIVHRAIEAHRGLVFVDANGNGAGRAHGTRFTVLLPLSPPDTESET